ncbi:MAG TPA: hypothetical protein VJT75_06300 [Thermoleophilaceae bacterium]|nr:hypothetical protein [Thermoleophilaceae bacterium]
MLSKTRITVLALTGAIAMTGAAEAASTPKLTIKGPNGDFQGTIKAKKRKCMNGRTVHVFMKTDQGPQEIGSDTSELNADKTRGQWSTGNSGYKNGEFFAKADPKGSCKPLTSKTITVVTPGAEEPEGDDGDAIVVPRTAGGGLGIRLAPRTESPMASIKEVDGADGGWSREKCEDMLDFAEGLVDEIDKEANGGEMEQAAKDLDLAIKVNEAITDNCLVVYD